jgi:hypothetical protein
MVAYEFLHPDECDCLICINHPRLAFAISEVMLQILTIYCGGERQAGDLMVDLLQHANNQFAEPEETEEEDGPEEAAQDEYQQDAPPAPPMDDAPGTLIDFIDLTDEVPVVDLTADEEAIQIDWTAV